jgi:hypothetical protein
VNPSLSLVPACYLLLQQWELEEVAPPLPLIRRVTAAPPMNLWEDSRNANHPSR